MARFGKIGDQYFDDAGKPLAFGLLYFYESGSDTEKDTFKDPNLSIKNTNPVKLSASGRQPNIWFNGTARVVLTTAADPVTGQGTQIEERDPEGGTFLEGVFSPWNALTLYSQNDIVEGSDGNFYISLTDNNQNNDPTTNQTNWTRIRFIRVWNPNETYSQFDVVEGSDGLLYSSKTDSNLNNDPVADTSLVNWQAATSADVEPIVRAVAAQYAYDNF